MSAPGDTLYRGRTLHGHTGPEQRQRALAVLAAGFTQGTAPRAALAQAAQLRSQVVVVEMIADGLIVENADGTLGLPPPPPQKRPAEETNRLQGVAATLRNRRALGLITEAQLAHQLRGAGVDK